MTTRKALILSWADEQSAVLIDGVGPKNKIRKENLEKISKVCRALVARAKPLCPSAEEVKESATALGFETFPSPRTIYNTYGEMLQIWRKAWRDIGNIEKNPSPKADALLAFDASGLDLGTQEVIGELKRLVRELLNHVKGLKQIVAAQVPVYLEKAQIGDEDVMVQLCFWVKDVLIDGFSLDQTGLLVSRHTGPGTPIMPLPLWDGLNRMGSIYEASKKAEKQTPKRHGVERDEGEHV